MKPREWKSGKVPCIICASPNVVPVAELAPVPIDTNRIWFSRAEARAAPKAAISLACCNVCGHLFNHGYNDDLVTYAVDYENSQISSPRFRRYAEDLADILIAKHDLHWKRIVEIGGGRGEFLKIICDRGNNRGVSIGPSYRPRLGDDLPRNIRFITDYYTERYRDEPADMIICRQVLEHFWGPRDFIATVREAVDGRRNVVVYFEVPNGDWILYGRAFWEFHYQHVSYFSKNSVNELFTRCGFEVSEIQEKFEGQFLGIEARAAAPDFALNQDSRGNREQTMAACRSFEADFDARVASWRDHFAMLRARGRRIVAWGAGAKAVTFLNMVDPTRDIISHIIDLNPRKTGCFVPGTGHEIVEPRALQELRPDEVLIMNAIYRDEINSMLLALGLDPIVLVA